jgi:4-amino-4-deoxy-L-arabinose transferase-like glycosyltransferase
VAAVLPMCRYMNPTISNEAFAGTVIACALLAAVGWGTVADRQWWQAMLIGAACGLALLAKYTALFVGGAVVGFLLLRVARERSALWPLLVVLAAFLVAGWHYGRNFTRFGTPFIGNWDEASGYHYHDEPGYRTLRFYATFSGVLTHQPERARWSSFWDGMYGSAWGDIHGTFLALKNKNVQAAQTVLYWLALGPTLAAVVGAGRTLRFVLRERWDHPYTLLLLYAAFSVTGLVLYTLRLPHETVMKAFFLLSLVPAAAVFAGLGLDLMARQLGRLRWLLYVNVGALVLLALGLFWYAGT